MFQVRRMRDGDEEAVISLLNTTFPHVAMTREKLKTRLLRGARFFVAVSGGEVAGFADLRIGRYALLRGIAVEAGWKGKGVGDALLKKAVGEAKMLGKDRVRLKVRVGNAEAVKLYKENGFAIEGEEEDRFGGRVYRMIKRVEN